MRFALAPVDRLCLILLALGGAVGWWYGTLYESMTTAGMMAFAAQMGALVTARAMIRRCGSR